VLYNIVTTQYISWANTG